MPPEPTPPSAPNAETKGADQARRRRAYPFEFGRLIGKLAGLLALDPNRGDAAQLRRSIDSAVFYKWNAKHEFANAFGHGSRDERERSWAVVLQALATVADSHDYKVSLGATLAEANVTELRFMKLSRARGDALFTEIRALAQRLSAAGGSFDHADLAWLVLSDAYRDEVRDKARRQLARDYFTALNNKNKNASSEK